MSSDKLDRDGPHVGHTSIVAATAQIALHLLRTAGEGNPVVAPFGAYLALSMLAQGARGRTRDDLDRALGIRADGWDAALTELRADLSHFDGDPALAAQPDLPDRPVLHLASRLVFTDQLEPEPAFSAVLGDLFDAPTVRADLSGSAGGDQLSRWVNHHTGGLVDQSAVSPSRDLALVIQDVAVLAARWRHPFAAALTADRPFRTMAAGRKRRTSLIQVPTMVGSSMLWATAECQGWTALRLPYQSGFVSDVLLPPDDGTDPARIDAQLLESLRSALDSMSSEPREPVEVYLPRVRLSPPTLDLRPGLESLGLADLFDRPDLSGVTAEIPLAISQASAQTRLVMDEAGTLAAAVTEIALRARGIVTKPPTRVQVDRPYLVRIGHEGSGLTLFLAAVRDPRSP